MTLLLCLPSDKKAILVGQVDKGLGRLYWLAKELLLIHHILYNPSSVFQLLDYFML